MAKTSSEREISSPDDPIPESYSKISRKHSDKDCLNHLDMSEQVQANPQELSNKPMPSANQELPGPVLATKEPDQLTYKDNEGVEHKIRIPTGQFQQACQHYMEKDWEALGRFPQWST